MAPRGGVMLVRNRSLRANKVSFQLLRIAQVGDKVVYFASPGGRPPTPVTLITLEKDHAVFESKRNDFPQRIIYTRHGDAFFARMEGKSVGKEKAIEWRWHRGEPQDPSPGCHSKASIKRRW